MLTLNRVSHPGGGGQLSKYYKGTETKCLVPIWTTESHFFRSRDTHPEKQFGRPLLQGLLLHEGPARTFTPSNHPHITPTSFLPDAVVPGPGQQPQVQVAGMIPKQETVPILLNLYVRIHKGLMERAVPSSHLAKLG